jgi:YD repeat-containing protein
MIGHDEGQCRDVIAWHGLMVLPPLSPLRRRLQMVYIISRFLILIMGGSNAEGESIVAGVRNQMAGPRTMTRIVGMIIALAICSAAYGQTFYGASGRVTGHARTDSRGVTTFYDPSNRITGRARTDANGTITFYDASGRVTGKSK